ncbi:MAG: OmpH family outer membrane protein, partial [Phycisphaeraceae bacterium]|nr:OmpH family outer membrane protein [Phycisphaeraceae bacterium]
AEIQRQMAESGNRLAAKQAELIEPIRAKMQETIATVAEQEGYSYVLNSVDGAGTSIVLYGPEDRNLTMKIAEALGVQDAVEATESTGSAEAAPETTEAPASGQ